MPDQGVLEVTDDVRGPLGVDSLQIGPLHGAEAGAPSDGAALAFVGDAADGCVDGDQLPHQPDILTPHLHLKR